MRAMNAQKDPSMPSGGASPPASSRLAKYAEHWLTPEAEIRYVETRRRGQFRHYDKEQELVGRWLRRCEPGAIVLDIPCGTGRFSELAQSCGHRLLRGDLSYAMVAHARHLGPNRHCLGDLCCDLAMPPLTPGSVDIVLVWRLFHHCRTPADREMVLRQAGRLARQYVIVSYYNRASITYWSRRFVRRMLGRAPKCRGAIWTGELLQVAGRVGLDPAEIYHYRPGISINSAACFAVRPTSA
jgi:SAM-dependent methyltransferase